ncbi:hypothetical protein Cflav_PD2193 [Pedosphaera parvula Ellin514]|uniref:Uncharacterized protein n=1 Tax=Pedosphaera parvula (strain Ellin514) TaxID=320771 RepID=B9XM72_PEDPL|nr:hypothetical protein Cflav_PD2193 [Pedosphaera parvula Ellin514]
MYSDAHFLANIKFDFMQPYCVASRQVFKSRQICQSPIFETRHTYDSEINIRKPDIS